MPRVEVVLFDVGGTLLRVYPSVGAVYSAVATQHGFQVPPERIDISFRLAWGRSIERALQRGYRTSDDLIRLEWFEIVRETFGASIPAAELKPLFEDLYERFVSASAWQLAPGARASLAHLRQRGLRLGILSNWDSRLGRVLRQLEIDRAFDFTVVSHEVGFEKPHAEIFAAAVRRADAPPEKILHVGDSLDADINPARSVGMRTLWVATREERERNGRPDEGIDQLPDKAFWDTLLSG